MAKSQLTAKKRNNSLNPRQLRSSGKVPATLYGRGMESISIEVDTKEFTNTYKKDKYAIFELNIENKTFNSIVKKVQKKPTGDNVLNIEFLHIREDETVKITVPIKITGESPAVKAGAELSVNLTEMEVECLPADMPNAIELDISKLENYEDFITVEQINYPEGVKSLLNPDVAVVRASVPKAPEETEEAAPEEEGTVQAEETPAEE